MNCPGPNSATVDPVAGADPVDEAHPADEAVPAAGAHPVAGADPADDPELPDRVVVAVLAGDLVSPARRDSSDVKLGIPRT